MRSVLTANATKIAARIAMVAFVMSVFMFIGPGENAWAKAPGKTAGPQGFSSPEAAVQAFIEAVKTDDEKTLLAIFGKDGKDLVTSGDATADRRMRERFLKMYEAQHQLVKQSERMIVLEVGAEKWPFPVPLLREGDVWHFDGRVAREEILNRRIGGNEMSAIQVCLAYVDAQREYAGKDRDGDGLLEYAQQVVSSQGQQDGLFWPEAAGREASPLGPFFARAQEEGYRPNPASQGPSPYHGYFYRILKAQGKNAPGGAQDYVIKGSMVAGFALVAYPARYGSSGIMTFIVSHSGVVYQKNLGPKTSIIARAMQRFDPDKTWQKVK